MASNVIGAVSEARRRFLNATLGFFGMVISVGALYPVGMYLWPRQARQAGQGARSMKIPIAEAPIGEVRFFRFFKKPVVVLRPNEQEVLALSVVCTHLGCIVKWNESKGEFICPCHGGRFNAKGEVLGGPPPKPLRSYSVKVADEYIVIEEA